MNGGPLEWIIFGLEKVDPKIRRLGEINEILAYKPWILSKDHIQYLIKGSSHSENFTIQEMLKATVILSTYHGLCGLCMGMGLLPDQDIIDEMNSLIGTEVP